MKGMMIEMVCLWSLYIETLDPAFRFSVKSFDNGLMKMGSETTNSMCEMADMCTMDLVFAMAVRFLVKVEWVNMRV